LNQLLPAGDAKMKLTADRKEILANRQDLSYITVEITDKDGYFNRIANNLRFQSEGGIVGVDNADLKTGNHISITRTERKNIVISNPGR
jgi:beta-galactosidase